MKKKRLNRYGRILAGQLGTATGRKRSPGNNGFVLSKSMDDGEVLVQRQSQEYVVGQSADTDAYEEYVVGQSAETIAFEEYVVGQSAETIAFEEYVVGQSAETTTFEEYVVGQSADVSGAFSEYEVVETKVNSLSADDNADVTIQQELNTDMFNAFDNPVSKQQSRQHAPAQDNIPVAETYSADTKPTASEDDFISDMQSILSGEKVFDPVSKKAVNRESLTNAQSNNNNNRSNNQQQQETNDGHAIFKKIAENMQYANAYDLGTVELENRFADFDRIDDVVKTRPAPAARTTQPAGTPPPVAAAQGLQADNTDFIQDLDAIIAEPGRGFSEAKTGETAAAPAATPDWPARPTTIRPYTLQEKIAAFGQFTYEPDPSTFGGDGIRVTNNWAQQNIISVDIPQLNGKRMGRTTISHGTIQFHKDGADRLRALWTAWGQAGLLDRVLTFEGGYAARFIRNTQSRNPRPLSNHAWGTAFDINAAWNGFGSEPALLGQQGCVRELVAIANSHGFFWGGHFRGSKDGMHFELGKTI